MTAFVLRAVFAALGLWLATEWVDGITVDSAATLLMAGLLWVWSTPPYGRC